MHLLIAILFLGLVHNPIDSVGLFNRLIQFERRQVLVDNASLSLSRSDQKLFSYVKQLNNQISYLDDIHHTFHFCASVSAYCFKLDQLYERSISKLVRVMEQLLQMRWVTVEGVFKMEIIKKNEKIIYYQRPTKLPLQRRPCLKCAGPWYFVFSPASEKIEYLFELKDEGLRPRTRVRWTQADLEMNSPLFYFDPHSRENLNAK